LKLSRFIIVIVVVVVIVIAAIYALGLLTSSPSLCTSSWQCGAEYPVQIDGTYAIGGQQCIAGTATIICIGGVDANGGPRNEIYYAAISSSGNITGWTLSSTTYPKFIDDQSCVTSSGYIYCVGGSYDDSYDDVNSSYYAQVMPSGTLGSWSPTTGYPIPVDTESCAAYSSYIYCVGGYNETDGSSADAAPSNSVWYAPLSSSGIGGWNLTTAYPASVYLPTCYSADGYIYCIGGANVNDNSVGTSYYATLSSTGVGTWTQTETYPVAASAQACVVSSTDLLCVGGETSVGSSSSAPTFTSGVYYAPITSGGIGKWDKAASYPISIGTDCVSLSGNVYCVGGFDQSSVGSDSFVEYTPVATLLG
jgi:hypothetical protein